MSTSQGHQGRLFCSSSIKTPLGSAQERRKGLGQEGGLLRLNGVKKGCDPGGKSTPTHTGSTGNL